MKKTGPIPGIPPRELLARTIVWTIYRAVEAHFPSLTEGDGSMTSPSTSSSLLLDEVAGVGGAGTTINVHPIGTLLLRR